eukprot:scaffold533_cov86-Skeletonema_dohrnii-CCMP3373.AAC.1
MSLVTHLSLSFSYHSLITIIAVRIHFQSLPVQPCVNCILNTKFNSPTLYISLSTIVQFYQTASLLHFCVLLIAIAIQRIVVSSSSAFLSIVLSVITPMTSSVPAR